ncbi:LysM domain-containing protein [Paenibacillus sp. UNC499MF]|uniref:LysM peptidoglycan-binding domain-containing protein n=1 Tax=Paenibacillus sp. UNC499MF TaxID=1502751 RepID=UPI0008A05785|nr:LysM domain-containing protein [Paenibacillus sp. UNC499MF]SEG06093.1 LysM domain-containing protein [Paenibacillus sp. UNC499MF]
MIAYFANPELTLHTRNGELSPEDEASPHTPAVNEANDPRHNSGRLTARTSDSKAERSVRTAGERTSVPSLKKSNRNIVRTAVIAFVLLIAFSCVIMVRAFASGENGTADVELQAAAINKQETAEPSVIVQRGDTLWSIAANQAPEGSDVRAYIYKLRKINDLSAGDVLKAGDVIKLP